MNKTKAKKEQDSMIESRKASENEPTTNCLGYRGSINSFDRKSSKFENDRDISIESGFRPIEKDNYNNYRTTTLENYEQAFELDHTLQQIQDEV